jgi:hypothetical protein
LQPCKLIQDDSNNCMLTVGPSLFEKAYYVFALTNETVALVFHVLSFMSKHNAITVYCYCVMTKSFDCFSYENEVIFAYEKIYLS